MYKTISLSGTLSDVMSKLTGIMYLPGDNVVNSDSWKVYILLVKSHAYILVKRVIFANLNFLLTFLYYQTNFITNNLFVYL